MPIYEYRCTDCGETVEVIQKLGARKLRKCTSCGGRLEKLISRAAFHLKGGGWFSEGYDANGKKPEKAPAADSKPETKPAKEKAAAGSGGGKKQAGASS